MRIICPNCSSNLNVVVDVLPDVVAVVVEEPAAPALPEAPGLTCHSLLDCIAAASELGYPVVVRSAFTSSGRLAFEAADLRYLVGNLLSANPTAELVIERWVDEINLVDPDADATARHRAESHLAMSTPDGPDGSCYYDRHPEEPRPEERTDLPLWSAGRLGIA